MVTVVMLEFSVMRCQPLRRALCDPSPPSLFDLILTLKGDVIGC